MLCGVVGRWILLCLALFGRPFTIPSALAAQAPQQPVQTLTPEEREKINEWTDAADKAFQANDLDAAEKLYKKVLEKDRYDPIALKQLQAIDARRAEAAKKKETDDRDKRARRDRDELVAGAIAKASERLALARQTGSGKYLDDARAANDEARHLAGDVDYPELKELGARIDSETLSPARSSSCARTLPE